MKNLLFIYSLTVSGLFCTGTDLLAQNAEGGRFRAGLTFGAVASDIPGLDTRDNDSDFHKLGISFGGIINTRISQKNTIQLEINYTMKGALQPPDSLNMGYSKLSLSYIEVPVLIRHTLHMNLHRKPMDRLEIEGGVSAGRLFSAGYIDDSNYPQAIDINSLNRIDVSLLAGLSFNLTPNLYFTVRYSNSVNPAVKRNKIDPHFVSYTWNNGNNQVVLFAVKYVFGKPVKYAEKAPHPDPAPAE